MRLRPEDIRAQRAIIEIAKGKRIRRTRVPRSRYPNGERIQYAQELLTLIRECSAAVRRAVDLALPGIVLEAGRLKHVDGLHTDALEETLDRTIGQLKLELGRVVPRDRARKMAAGRAARVNTKNRIEVGKQIKAVIGIDLGLEPKVAEYLPVFIRENVALIESIPSDLLGHVDRILTRGTRLGLRSEEIAKQIEAKIDISESKAAFIARDQIGTLNGKLTELRQKSVGARKFRWRTSLDERVRGNPSGLYPDAEPSHWDREGEIYEWDNPPNGEIPGEAYNCRCTAEIVVEDLLDNLDL